MIKKIITALYKLIFDNDLYDVDRLMPGYVIALDDNIYVVDSVYDDFFIVTSGDMYYEAEYQYYKLIAPVDADIPLIHKCEIKYKNNYKKTYIPILGITADIPVRTSPLPF